MANTFDSQQLLSTMLSTAKEIAQNDWDEIEQIAKKEFGIILRRIEDIGIDRKADRLSEGEAQFLLSAQVSLSQIVLNRLEVLGTLKAQRMINTVFNAIGGIVNRFVGFELIEVED